MTRREFAGGVAALAPSAAQTPAQVIDAHCHLHHHGQADWAERDRKLIAAADRLHIDQLCCSIVPDDRPTTLESCREANRWMREGMQRFPGRVLGYAFINPGYGREALEEVRRAIEESGFIGIKLYNDYRATDPIVFPMIELSIQLKAPVLHHAGHATWLPTPQPAISDGGHLAELARRYPEAKLICAHIAGGGDWEWTIKALRHAPNVWLDASGSVPDLGIIDMAVAVLGAERLLFATDGILTPSLGRMRGATLTPVQRAQIMGGNMRGILDRRPAR